MWKAWGVGVLAGGFGLAQWILNPELLLPEAHHVEGVVADAEGKPLAEAYITNANARGAIKTDSDGKFSLETQAPAFVVRKIDYRGALVRTLDAANVRLTLQKSAVPFLTCSKAPLPAHTLPMQVSFRFPKVKGVTVGALGIDADYTARSYYIQTKDGIVGIRHGMGPLWGSGLPNDRDVWRSVRYDETVFEAEFIELIDARGQLANGKRWRHLGLYGQTASYSDVDPANAAILDKVLDGACLEVRRGR